MLVHSSSMAVRSCWILAGTGTRCRIRPSRLSQTCSMGDVSDACPYHNPTATMGHSIHNTDIRKPLIHTTPHMLSAICPEQCKPGFIREENTSTTSQTPSNLSEWLVSDDVGGEHAGCGGPGLVWLHVVCAGEAGWMYCQIL
ncbi:uncharacterized protein LOC129190083 isoform X2 [Dunckerocampus dactyliophorus]|uniref:uncharacterized protein LOC129190083 isoform X2 n=1 Tax=Dunckerocampus dactyliophorus TaxID=161453 RepID=UPI0024054032|nr:uncharacterized protein LOC129190083 isoform X2 [Dunckerocampus dactyliophorus]